MLAKIRNVLGAMFLTPKNIDTPNAAGTMLCVHAIKISSRLWEDLPDSFSADGLVPQNPWIPVVHEALIALPDRTGDFEFAPQGRFGMPSLMGHALLPRGQMSLWPRGRLWSLIVARSAAAHFVAFSSAFFVQNSPVLSALSNGALGVRENCMCGRQPDGGDHMRALLTNIGNISEYEHPDLWGQVHHLLSVSLADVYVHKVASHTSEQNSDGPLHDFARIWNDHADFQAGVSNLYRPAFFTRVWDRYIQFRQDWKRRVELATSFFVDMANFWYGQSTGERSRWRGRWLQSVGAQYV